MGMRISARYYSDEGHLAEIERRLERTPGDVDLRFERACCLEDLGWEEAASQAYLAVLQVDARHLGALTNLGLFLRERGDLPSARALLMQALAHHPTAPIAHVNLGQTWLEQGEFASAVENYTAALAFDPEFFAAHHGLALAYETIGDVARAQHHLERAFEKRASWTLPYHGAGEPLRVLLLASARGGDVVTHPFLDDRIMQTTMFVPEGFRAGSALPPHDVVFNGIGDADRCAKALAPIRALLQASRAGVINAPEAVAATGRAALAERFAGIDRVVVPRVERIARAELTLAELDLRGWPFPLLVRAPGYHAGRHFERVDEPAALPNVLARLPGEELFLMSFLDARAPDGFVRKYRVLGIDGEIYPAHLAVSDEWKVHYFSSSMSDRSDHREEERRFLAGMGEALGSSVVRTLEQVVRAMGLDYGGVDFSLDAAGNVLVFEANATMAVFPPPAEERWAYRRPAYDAVVAAVRALIARRAFAAPSNPRV
jgi:tetratricopeptide (TPR) repeat protein